MDGYFKNEAVATPGFGSRTPTFSAFAPEKNLMVRGTAIFTPTDWYTGRLKLNFAQDKITGGGFAGQVGFWPDGTGGVAPRNIAFLTGEDCKVYRVVRLAWMDPSGFPGISNGGEPYSNLFQRFGTFEQHVKLGDGLTLTSVTGGYGAAEKFLIQGSTASAVMPLALQNIFYSHEFTQECGSPLSSRIAR
jgi:hypothetical protein